MADIAAAKEVLRGLRREVVELEPGVFGINNAGQSYVITSSEIDAYLNAKDRIQRPIETELFHPGHYEHVVQIEGAFARRPPRGDEQSSVSNADGTTTIEIGRPSTLLCLTLTDNDRIHRDIGRLLSRFMMRVAGNNQRRLSEAFRIQTISVKSSGGSSSNINLPQARKLAEAAAFHFAYGQGQAISFTRSWERASYWIGRKESETIQYPLRHYKTELINYYTLALSSESLVLSYLALYNILEFFYTSASEKLLHDKIKEQLVSPDFSHTKPRKLRDLVKLIRKIDNKTDELASLNLVISQHFTPEELRTWIEDYERDNGAHFTAQSDVFGESYRLDTSNNTIIPNLSSRIYRIRNAIVHNKEGELSRFVPYTGQEESLSKEIRIILFLAEQIIIKTGTDF